MFQQLRNTIPLLQFGHPYTVFLIDFQSKLLKYGYMYTHVCDLPSHFVNFVKSNCLSSFSVKVSIKIISLRRSNTNTRDIE